MLVKNVMQEYEGRILPQDHPLTKHVKRVARRIITSNDLGRLTGETKIHVPDSWDPLRNVAKRDREWTVLVVNDKNFVNAFAGPGLSSSNTSINVIC
jgi:metalloendopeptidase OMA1, mitochondrial